MRSEAAMFGVAVGGACGVWVLEPLGPFGVLLGAGIGAALALYGVRHA